MQFDVEEHPSDVFLTTGQSTEGGFFLCVELMATSQRLLLCVLVLVASFLFHYRLKGNAGTRYFFLEAAYLLCYDYDENHLHGEWRVNKMHFLLGLGVYFGVVSLAGFLCNHDSTLHSWFHCCEEC